MENLLDLTQEAKNGNNEAVKKIIDVFEPKLKSSSWNLPASNQEDLKQELKIQIIKALNRFETSNTPGFWEFIYMSKK